MAGPFSPNWITVTEYGIKQSFDMTRVMFSRGNVTEKIRFGKELVQEGEIVLDMYGGIGYFTLPALIHGHAKHVYVCEWNHDGVEALRFNLRQNGVEDKATVLVGDCRKIFAKKENQGLVGIFDRVSLGLLPSSEGGWRTAVHALRRDLGGWLHIHGNVPVVEARSWCKWLCIRLKEYLLELMLESNNNESGDADCLHHQWVVVCWHLEKVKSFAPTVNHYVADMYLGPSSRLPSTTGLNNVLPPGAVALRSPKQHSPHECDGNDKIVRFELCPETVDLPSCALSKTGALHQEWMR